MGFVFPNTTVLAMSPHSRIAGNASAALGFLQFGVSAIGGLIVSAIQNAQVIPTAVPISATIALCSGAALWLNLLTHSTSKTAAASVEPRQASSRRSIDKKLGNFGLTDRPKILDRWSPPTRVFSSPVGFDDRL